MIAGHGGASSRGPAMSRRAMILMAVLLMAANAAAAATVFV
jgi:hypothetical protein